MKTIIDNPNKLKDNEMNITTNKVRALILDNYNNIIITKYADMYMLPGDKVDKDESYEKALIRELKEELGIEFEIKEITPFIKFKNYLKNYPLADSNIKYNKLNVTTYYIIKTNKKIDINKSNLTEREKENSFSIMYLELKEALKVISNHNSSNERNLPFKTELIKVLREFNNTSSIKSLSEYILELENKEYENAINTLKNMYTRKIINPYKQSEKLIDLHAHTCYSDGELTPDELINLAIENNIGILAITDHDTVEGIKSINKKDSLIVDSGIKIINGIELSAKVDIGTMHILGYNIDINNKDLNNKLIELKDNSVNSVLSVIEQLKKDYNIFFTYNELKELINANHNLGRPDIARLLIKKGYVKTVQEAFDKYLIDAHSKIKDRRKGISYIECIDLVLKSNGIPVLAHPKTLKLNDKELLYLLKDMISHGLMGIEVYHSSHSKEERNKYLSIADELGLLVSGGSDYHGVNTKPDIELGTGKNNNLKIKKLSILDKLKR